jgi:hypothetical protein
VTATSTTVISERLRVAAGGKGYTAPRPAWGSCLLLLDCPSRLPLSVTPLGARAEERTLHDEVRQEIFW